MSKEDIKRRIEELRAEYLFYASTNHPSPELFRKMHKVGQEFLELELKLSEEEEK